MDDIANDAEHAEKNQKIRDLEFALAQWQAKACYLERDLQEARNAPPSLRDEFAKAALIGLLSNPANPSGCDDELDIGKRRLLISKVAYEYADKMLKARG